MFLERIQNHHSHYLYYSCWFFVPKVYLFVIICIPGKWFTTWWLCIIWKNLTLTPLSTHMISQFSEYLLNTILNILWFLSFLIISCKERLLSSFVIAHWNPYCLSVATCFITSYFHLSKLILTFSYLLFRLCWWTRVRILSSTIISGWLWCQGINFFFLYNYLWK